MCRACALPPPLTNHLQQQAPCAAQRQPPRADSLQATVCQRLHDARSVEWPHGLPDESKEHALQEYTQCTGHEAEAGRPAALTATYNLKTGCNST